ncbi:MAG: RNA 2',3'-cyclic phosphodiesterase [Anaerolineae bacterium]|nr:RNA 2',3'-cyclic phosphodiesterase [Anaerolineae bacterium]
MLRLFIAVELPRSVREALAEVQRGLRAHPGSRHVRWTDPEGTHLTLRFLGETQEQTVPAVERCLVEACLTCPPLKLKLDGIGAFPSRKRPRVVWVGLDAGDDAERLAALQGALERGVVRLGYPPEERAFSAHLTLGRVRRGAGPRELGEVTEMLDVGVTVPALSFEVPSVSLMCSTLRPEGAVYSRVSEGVLVGR